MFGQRLTALVANLIVMEVELFQDCRQVLGQRLTALGSASPVPRRLGRLLAGERRSERLARVSETSCVIFLLESPLALS